MSFNVLAIRSGDEAGDDALHPLLSDVSQPEIIALDDYDGQQVMRVVATAVRVMAAGPENLKPLVRLRDVKIDVYITDGRLALACEKYDKGGGWIGFGGAGVLIAVTANTVSKIRAANRSRGKALVGHIRYPWVKAVGAASKSGFGSAEAIRLEFCEKLSGAAVGKVVELTLPNNIDATLVAQEITRRIAVYRLAHYPGMAQEDQAKFAELSQSPPRLQPPPRKFAFCQMPTYYFVSAHSAFPRSRGPWTPGPDRTLQPDVQVHGLTPRPPAAPADMDGPSDGGQVPVFCTQCGTRGVAGDRFCAECGAAMKDRTRS